MAIIKLAQMARELSGSYRQGRGMCGISNQGQGVEHATQRDCAI